MPTEKGKECDEDVITKLNILLTCICKKGCKIYNTFTFDGEEEKMKFKTIAQECDESCCPRKDITFSGTSSLHVA